MRFVLCQETTRPCRKIWCKRYESCLAEAARAGYSGFSCARCDEYEPMEWDPEQATADGIACMAFVLALFHPKAYKNLSPGAIRDELERRAREGQGFGEN